MGQFKSGKFVVLCGTVKSGQIRDFFWSEYGKMRTRKTPYLNTFHAVRIHGLLLNCHSQFQILLSDLQKEADEVLDLVLNYPESNEPQDIENLRNTWSKEKETLLGVIKSLKDFITTLTAQPFVSGKHFVIMIASSLTQLLF